MGENGPAAACAILIFGDQVSRQTKFAGDTCYTRRMNRRWRHPCSSEDAYCVGDELNVAQRVKFGELRAGLRTTVVVTDLIRDDRGKYSTRSRTVGRVTYVQHGCAIVRCTWYCRLTCGASWKSGWGSGAPFRQSTETNFVTTRTGAQEASARGTSSDPAGPYSTGPVPVVTGEWCVQ